MKEMEAFKKDDEMADILVIWNGEVEKHKGAFSEVGYRNLLDMPNNLTVKNVSKMQGYLVGILECGKFVGSLISLTRLILAQLEAPLKEGKHE